MYRYYTKGICPKSILMDIKKDILEEVVFEGGCTGNLIAIKVLIEGREIGEIIELLEDIPCRGKTSSCPAQLAIALKIYKNYAK